MDEKKEKMLRVVSITALDIAKSDRCPVTVLIEFMDDDKLYGAWFELNAELYDFSRGARMAAALARASERRIDPKERKRWPQITVVSGKTTEEDSYILNSIEDALHDVDLMPMT